jgi:thymidylate kinase
MSVTLVLPSKASSYSETSQIIGIEGLPGAGKTTILAAIAEELEGKAILLSELNFEPNSPYGKLPIKDQGDVYLRLWIERMTLLKTVKDPSFCFMTDRTYFSNFAYIYALDALKGTHYYHNQIRLFINNLLEIPFNKLFVFDVHPEIGLQRRRLRGDQIPWPWSEEKFLKALHQFYKKELPQFGIKNIQFINTLEDKEMTISNLKKEVLKSVDKTQKQATLYTHPNETQEKALYFFAKRKELGEPCIRILNVLGVPTLYFLKHSLQIANGRPVFFNNEQLYNLLKVYSRKIFLQGNPSLQEKANAL